MGELEDCGARGRSAFPPASAIPCHTDNNGRAFGISWAHLFMKTQPKHREPSESGRTKGGKGSKIPSPSYRGVGPDPAENPHNDITPKLRFRLKSAVRL